MATKAEKVSEEVVEEGESNPLVGAAHKVLLAGIGAMALTQEAVEDFVNKLVERGEIAEKDGRKMIQDVMEKRKKRTKNSEGDLTGRVQEVLDRLTVPSKKDIEALSAQIAELTKKVDQLTETKS